MADPTTILEYATKRSDRAKAAVAAAQQRLATAQAGITADSDAVARATTAFSDLDKQAAEIRQELSTIPTPADGVALVAALEQTTIRLRTAQGTVLRAQAGLLMTQADVDQAQLDLANASTQLTKAAADLALADQATNQRAARALVLAGAPLATLATDATNALDETTLPAPLESENYRKAKARITADIPAKLLTRAKDRRDDASALITQADADTRAAEDAGLKERNDNGGLAGAAQKTWALFQRAEADVEDFVSTAKARFDQAQANLARVADLTNSPLTAEQTARINAPDPLKGLRETAAGAEKTRDDKLKAIADKRVLLDAAILTAIVKNTPANQQSVTDKQQAVDDAQAAFDLADVWLKEEKDRDTKLAGVATAQAALAQAIQAAIAAGNDPDTDVNVGTAKTNLKTAQDNLKTAEDTYDLSNHGILHAWEAAVPDTMWRLLDDFEEAEQILNTLKDSDPAQLQSELVTAEANYVGAQLAADASASVLAQLVAEQAQREARQATEHRTAATGRFGALRGDN